MKSYSLFVLLLLPLSLLAQQWLDKTYDYTVQSDVIYGTATNFVGTTDTLTLDIYIPECQSKFEDARRPMMMWIHGGAFLDGHKNDPSIVDLCIQFAQRGYVTASINYRKGFVSDDVHWQCNYPNYSCVFAHDAAEWERAYYRGVQDAKGALRWLVNHRDDYQIDTDNIFLSGESAGAFLALGAALLDSESERPESTFAIAEAPAPHTGAQTCVYNAPHDFDGSSIERPDLGPHPGTIVPTEIDYVVKGVGNMYGGMLSDLLAEHNADFDKPAIYSFHQPCDLVVPIDSGNVFMGLSWCMTNGFGCSAIANTTSFFGSRTIDYWNTSNEYGYPMLSEFAGPEFPYNYWFGEGSCVDQAVNDNGCHAYDSKALRENNLAAFFAPLVTTFPECLSNDVTSITELSDNQLRVYPNPAQTHLTIESNIFGLFSIEILDVCGRVVLQADSHADIPLTVSIGHLSSGVYFVRQVVEYPEKLPQIQRFTVE